MLSQVQERSEKQQYENYRSVRGSQPVIVTKHILIHYYDRRSGSVITARRGKYPCEILQRVDKLHYEYIFELRNDKRNIDIKKSFPYSYSFEFGSLVITRRYIHHPAVENKIPADERKPH